MEESLSPFLAENSFVPSQGVGCRQGSQPDLLSLTCSRSPSLPFLLSVRFLGGRMKSSAEVGRPGNTAMRIWSSGTLVTCKDVQTKRGCGGTSPPPINERAECALPEGSYEFFKCSFLGTGSNIHSGFLSVFPLDLLGKTLLVSPPPLLLHTFLLKLEWYYKWFLKHYLLGTFAKVPLILSIFPMRARTSGWNTGWVQMKKKKS